MIEKVSILYRGALSSCNFSCYYCPFSDGPDSEQDLNEDASALVDFVEWVGNQNDTCIGVFFTPRGEAMIHPHYQNAIRRLSRLRNVDRVAIQTNCSRDIDWLRSTQTEKIGLWVSWHPRNMSMEDLLVRCSFLRELGIRHSVGVVGCREHFRMVVELREKLPRSTYLWVNAVKDLEPFYTRDEVSTIEEIDPLFRFSLLPHPSCNRPCDAGRTVISVDGRGDIRRCHFVPEIIGSIRSPEWSRTLKERVCPVDECRCHIGYVHLPHLDLMGVFGAGILERVPVPEWEGWETWGS
jgi:MoaA/NifB/PqqE/SkfB family radical SAM enzyme